MTELKKKLVEVEVTCPVVDPLACCTLKGLLLATQRLIHTYGDEATFMVDSGYNHTTFSVSFMQEETDAEFEKRKAFNVKKKEIERKAKDKALLKERETYEKLKAKYGS